MSGSAQQFPFIARDPAVGAASLAPMMPLSLQGAKTVAVSALLDTGAAVNVLPYSIGMQLGFFLDQQTIPVRLSGNLASMEAHVVLVEGAVARFRPVRLAFAWTREESVPVILGQVNFFREFDVCFFRSESLFEVRLHSQ